MTWNDDPIDRLRPIGESTLRYLLFAGLSAPQWATRVDIGSPLGSDDGCARYSKHHNQVHSSSVEASRI